MLLTCPRCSRLNPPEALFCFHDGAALGDPGRRRAVGDPARQRFPMPFVFPSGLACHTFDELALAIQGHWEAAGELLGHGVLAGFFAGLGRGDLAVAAREAGKHPDRDQGLDELLRRLPSSVLEAPRLVAEPAQINLGRLRPGQDARFVLQLSNQGMGLASGTISCEDTPWLVLGEDDNRSRKKLFHFLHDTTVTVHVRGKALVASNKPVVARLVIDGNAGQLLVPVSCEVPVIPFWDGALAGAVTPRQVAQKARDNPRESADLFARGVVARWYEANGWTYPVHEPAASGLAAVQQFFEALGLTTPPKVGINVAEILLEGRGGDLVRSSLQVASQEKKPVFAHAISDQPWLAIHDIALDGRTATIHLRVPDVPNRPGETLHARVDVISNGRQRFVVPVRLNVTGPALHTNGIRHVPPVRGEMVVPIDCPPPVRRSQGPSPDEVMPVVEWLEEAPPVRKPEPVMAVAADVTVVEDEDLQDDRAGRVVLGRYAVAALPVLFIVFGLLITLVRDIHALVRKPGGVVSPDGFANLPQTLFIHFHDTEEEVRLSESGGVKPVGGRADPNTFPAAWEPSMRFGLDLGPTRRLTFEKKGLTNNTVVRLDGIEAIFGERPFRAGGRYLGDWPGRWGDREAPLDRPLRDGRKSSWVYENQRVLVTQTVGLVPGAQSGRIDTCLVHYKIDNRDNRPHQVGLRFLLDTFIGSNDGVPFLIPGQPELCNTRREFGTSQAIPDFIQARETEDLSRPGTIALIQLKIPGLEPPSRVTLGAWPNPALPNPLCRQEKTLWTVPVLPIKSLPQPDSAVVIYWGERSLPAGGSREMAFAYGLGSVSAGETGGQLGLSVVGSFVPGGEFTLTAEVRNPVSGQTVTATLPEGFTLVSGALTQPVPRLAPNAPSPMSPVTWRLRAGPREGNHTLRVATSTGVAQTLGVQIKVKGIFGN